MKKKNLFFTLIITCLLACGMSCSSDNDDGVDEIKIPDDETEEIERIIPIITATKYNANLFELVQLNLSTENIGSNNFGLGFALIMDYDSVNWIIPGFHSISGSPSTITTSYGISFHRPGEYKAIINAYVKDEIINSDSIVIKVYMAGDFLSIKWGDIKEYYNFFNCISYENNFQFNLSYSLDEGSPYATLTRQITQYIGEEDWAIEMALTRGHLDRYITGLYNESVFDYKGEDITKSPLIDEFDKRFDVSLERIKLASYIPITIWDTPQAHIALIGMVHPIDSITYYQIIAEPRKF